MLLLIYTGTRAKVLGLSTVLLNSRPGFALDTVVTMENNSMDFTIIMLVQMSCTFTTVWVLKNSV